MQGSDAEALAPMQKPAEWRAFALVEPEGFEPSSKRLQHELSTCFFLRWFSNASRERTPY